MPLLDDRAAAGVLVAHPGRQHSHQLAAALAEAGMLWAYWTGVPARPIGSRRLPTRLLCRLSRYDLLGLPHARVAHCFVAPIVRKLAIRTLPPATAADLAHRADGLFDRWSAAKLARAARRPPSLVVCYENSALHTFRAARRAGIVTMLDAASVHHSEQAKWLSHHTTVRATARIAARKDAEIAAADHILTASQLARDTYINAGVPPDRVTAVPLGVDLERFRGADHSCSGPVRFLFVGSAATTKGADVLSQALARLGGAAQHVSLIVVGGVSADQFAGAGVPVEHHGQLTQPALATLMREVDCLVLPSRFDSFGMVVIEALASGVPVVVSDRVGAKEAVTEGENGWIVPASDVGALAAVLRTCADRPEQLREMREAARRSATAFAWSAYRVRVAEVICELLAGGGRLADSSSAATLRHTAPMCLERQPALSRAQP